MKKIGILLLVFLFCVGCAAPAQPTSVPESTASLKSKSALPGKTGAARILREIWAEYEETERFAIFGGSPDRPVADDAGDLDMELPEKWLHRYRFPSSQQKHLDEGAAFGHLMNESLFTAVVFHSKTPKNNPALLRAWRQELQQTHWVSNRPAQLMLAQVDGDYVLMAYGSRNHMHTFREKLCDTFPSTHLFYYEPITV